MFVRFLKGKKKGKGKKKKNSSSSFHCENFNVLMQVPQFIHPLNVYDCFTVNRHLVHLQFKAIIKFCLEHSYTCLMIHKRLHFSWDTPGSGPAVWWGMCSSNFITKCKPLSEVIVLIPTPTDSAWEPLLLHISFNTSYYQIFNFTTLVCVLGSQYDFSLYFQFVNELEHAGIFLLVVWISFLWSAHSLIF